MSHSHHTSSVQQLALRATIHCLTGCGIGEVLGMVIGTMLGWSDLRTVVLAIALAANTLSIALMEVVDNAIMLVIPGAMEAPLTSLLFWGSLALALLLAGFAAYPLNRWLILRGRGHAVVHAHHQTTLPGDRSPASQAGHGHRHH